MNTNVPQHHNEGPPTNGGAPHHPPAPAPDRVGQGTAVEQSRAVAEVQGAIVLARQYPRNDATAIAAMRETCSMQRLAERAFFRFPRAGKQVTGASVHMARELARIWGNVVYGVKELRRDDQYSQSEMLAYAWDLQTNARSELVFIVPHKRDTKGGPKNLTDMRDVYENNANQGARRLRECIFSVLPPWFVEEAKEICNSTIANGGGKPLPQRIADAIGAFDTLGIIQKQLEKKIGRASENWTAHDVAQFGVIFKSIRNGEINKDDEFPPANNVTAAAINAQAGAQATDATEPSDAEPLTAAEPDPEPTKQDDGWPGPDTDQMTPPDAA